MGDIKSKKKDEKKDKKILTIWVVGGIIITLLGLFVDLVYFLAFVPAVMALLAFLLIPIHKYLKLMKESDGLKTFVISDKTIKDGYCRLFLTTDNVKIAVVHEKDKMKIFEIDESPCLER